MGSVISQLRQRDPHNQTIAILLLIFLANISHQYKKLRAYTFWNCTAILFNFAFRLRWERPLVCNSLAVLVSYKTASLDCHEQLARQAGVSRLTYFLGDQIFHVAPFFVLTRWLLKHKQELRPQHGAFALLGQFFFAYSQAGKMDVGDVYVTHDYMWCWLAGALGQLTCPFIVNNLIKGSHFSASLQFGIVWIPYIIKLLGWRPIINEDTTAQSEGANEPHSDDKAPTIVLCDRCRCEIKQNAEHFGSIQRTFSSPNLLDPF
mmetsp:Transcript_17401/g.21424  ORF Transcript_17401/g.21424 Transcript_17401/m.21424 type:complete len:262 (+) Transcript_17401:94-879(+)